MPNPLFKILSLKKSDFEKKYKISLCNSKKNGTPYYFLEPIEAVNTNQEIIINSENYKVDDFHFSVYEDHKLKHQYYSTTHHLTINISSKTGRKLNVHIYFDKNNAPLFFIVKDSQQNIIQLESTAALSQFSKSYAITFFNLAWEKYLALSEQYKKQHEKLLMDLTHASEKLPKSDKDKQNIEQFSQYDKQLDFLCSHLLEWNQIELQSIQPLINYFSQLQRAIKTKIIEAQEKAAAPVAAEKPTSPAAAPSLSRAEKEEPTPTPPKTNELKQVKKRLAILTSQSDMPSWRKIPEEHALQQQLFKLLTQDNEVLNCILRMKELERTAIAALSQLLKSPKQYQESIRADGLEILIRLIPQLTPDILVTMVLENRAEALKLTHKYHPYLNLDAPVRDPQADEITTLLEIAYKLKLLKIFVTLLECGAFCDISDKYGNTLLAKTCSEEKGDYMEALLKAGASDQRKNFSGSSAFAHIAILQIKDINSGKRPNLALANRFITYCKTFNINQYQGPSAQASTALCYACQNNWSETALFLLDEGADPFIARTSDNNNAFGICAGKGFDKLLELLLAKTTQTLLSRASTKVGEFKSIPELNSAYIAAKYNNKPVCISVLEQFASRHNIKLSETSVGIAIGSGAQMDHINRLLGSVSALQSQPPTLVPALLANSAIAKPIAKQPVLESAALQSNTPSSGGDNLSVPKTNP